MVQITAFFSTYHSGNGLFILWEQYNHRFAITFHSVKIWGLDEIKNILNLPLLSEGLFQCHDSYLSCTYSMIVTGESTCIMLFHHLNAVCKHVLFSHVLSSGYHFFSLIRSQKAYGYDSPSKVGVGACPSIRPPGPPALRFQLKFLTNHRNIIFHRMIGLVLETSGSKSFGFIVWNFAVSRASSTNTRYLSVSTRICTVHNA